MDKRIKELAEQAGFMYHITAGIVAGPHASPEMFAELIVRDVVETVIRNQGKNVSPDFEWVILNNYDLELNDE